MSNFLVKSETEVSAPSKRSMQEFLHHIGAVDTPNHGPDNILSVVGTGVGALAVPNHRVLGGIGGYTLGRNIPALMSSDNRNSAVCNLATTGGGIFGSLVGGRHGRPVIGFAVGYLVSGAIVYFGGFRK